MKSKILGSFVSLLALLSSSLGMAATVTIVPSTLTPTVGDTFTLTITGDAPNTFAATMALAFDASKVAFVSGTALTPWNVFTKNSAVTANPTVFDVETPSATSANPGTYNVALLTFTALAAGDSGILINDDGGNVTGWFDATTADWIPVTYTQATVTITGGGGGGTPNVVVTDAVAPTTDLEIPFGDVTETTTSGIQTLTLTNTGTQDLVVGTIALANGVAAPFSVVSDNCSGQTLAPSTPCTVGLEFSPASTGPFQDTFDIPTNDPDQASVTFTVSGNGTPVPVPNIVVTDAIAPTTDAQVPFGNIVQNQTSTQTLTVSNDGTANLNIGLIATANPLAAPFSIASDTCSNQTVAPSGNCTFQVVYEPTAVGSLSDTLDIPSNDPDTATVTVTVSGTGAPIPVADISVTDSAAPANDLLADFGDVNVSASANRTVTVTNAGTASLVLGSVATANPVAAPFSIVTDNCSGQTLAPAASCTVSVAYAPVAIGPANDSFDIPSNDPDEASVTLALTGNGLPPGAPDISVTDSTSPTGDLVVDFGDVRQPNSVEESVTITNVGTSSLVLGSVATANGLAGPFSIVTDNCSGQTLAPAATCRITLAFGPDAIQAFDDSFDIPSNDADEATVTVAVVGNGLERRKSGGSSALDPATLLVLGLFGFAARRRASAR